MIRDFSKCRGNLERITFLESVASKDYSQEELKALCNVMSFNAEDTLNKEELRTSMIAELKKRMKEEGMGISKVSQRLNEMDPIIDRPEKKLEEGSIKAVVDALLVHNKL